MPLQLGWFFLIFPIGQSEPALSPGSRVAGWQRPNHTRGRRRGSKIAKNGFCDIRVIGDGRFAIQCQTQCRWHICTVRNRSWLSPSPCKCTRTRTQSSDRTDANWDEQPLGRPSSWWHAAMQYNIELHSSVFPFFDCTVPEMKKVRRGPNDTLASSPYHSGVSWSIEQMDSRRPHVLLRQPVRRGQVFLYILFPQHLTLSVCRLQGTSERCSCRCTATPWAQTYEKTISTIRG